ncbi:hypothetical protein P9272_35495 [Mesorhizobium sp. WSM4976]|uniref:hypothetical protein n=1 Tax=Mesorhizobium sp. WSM4976 TaxID=3038549 RepID=UPI002417EF4F|nr:hypothetical protein [Mesorhizobium sp. WSM4976]MDG4898793.1 hypothetical protein [Mesorhizobium sp. WSM4976]
MNALANLKPFGMPAGVDPRTWRQAIEARVNELLDQSMALITALDLMEGDVDLEDGADAEPWLGWGERGPRRMGVDLDCRGSIDDDRELEDEHGGDVLDERHDGEEREADDADYDQPGFIWGGNEDGR